MSDTHGTVVWTELMTRDVEKAKAYYTEVCGMEFSTMPMEEGDYHLGSRGEQMVVGMMDMAQMPGMENIPAHWMTYLGVDDVDKAVAQTKAQGGTVFREPWDIEGVGRIAMIADPTGAALGLMTPS
jgi:predicted enzyme related to lactoylglutathione lyase